MHDILTDLHFPTSFLPGESLRTSEELERVSPRMSIPSDEDPDLDDTLPGPSFSHQNMDIETKIASLLQSLRLDENRRIPVTPEVDDYLKEVHEKINLLIRMEPDSDRKKWFKKAYLASNRIREELYNLRRVLPNTLPPQSYFDRVQPVLQEIVSRSFEEEYRKVAIILGLVDSLAELLILEVDVHGTTPRFPQHKSIRKLIANGLTNLTFGHGVSKKRLCSYPAFIPTTVRLFREAKNLVQVYAGLIRNLSWMADSEMTVSLNPCVAALASAAVEARKASDQTCVRAILSALWNLASHSTESKKALCDQPGCLQMLVGVLSTPNTETVDIESASGVLKYVSQYLANHSDHMELRTTLVRALTLHLSSSSFTALSNVLGALGNLISKDPHVQNEIRCDNTAMRQLTSLRDSNREDMSSLVKTVLSHLQQPASYRKQYNNMSASLGMSPYGNSKERILNRAVIASPGNPSPMDMPQFASPAAFIEPQRCSSLPRHFARGGYAYAPHGQVHQSSQFLRKQAYPVQQPTFTLPPEQSTFPEDGNGQDDELDAISYCANKSNASHRSLESELPSGWNSVPESVNTTANMSPVSAAELPASPSEYAKEKLMQEFAAFQAQGHIPVNSIPNPFISNGSDLSKNGGSDAATAVVEDYPTPTFPPYGRMNVPAPLQENDYVTLETTSNNLLQLSIEAALPPATPRTSKRQNSPMMDGAQLLAETIQSAMPQKGSRSGQRPPTSERLLQDCIQSAMPSPSFSSTLPKNVNGGRSQPVTTTDRRESHGHPFAEVTSSVLLATEEGSVRDANNLLGREDSSDDDFDHELDDDVDMSLPLDCIDEEEVTIDCSTLGRESRSSGIPKPSRLPKPTYRAGVSPRVKPPIKPKPQTHAVITPYNYQKPKESKTKSPEAKPIVHSGANTMLVTTV